MRSLRLITLIFPLSICTVSCTAMLQDFDRYGKNFNPVPLHRISIGQDKAGVEAALGAPANVIGSKSFPGGVVEVWEYQRWQANVGPDQLEERYWVYFLNGHVSQWGRPGDWEREADRIWEFRMR